MNILMTKEKKLNVVLKITFSNQTYAYWIYELFFFHVFQIISGQE